VAASTPGGDYSCDEYPFGSTYEGAAAETGTARTFAWCQISLEDPPSSGGDGFSICMVPDGENSGAGGKLGVFYTAERVLDGDAFFVDVATGADLGPETYPSQISFVGPWET
jgi:hypothetical protein